MEWTQKQEDFLTKLHFECHTLSEYNRKQYEMYSRINQRFSIPILVISGLNSLFAVSTQNFIKQDFISIINASLSLFCSILGSIQLFMKIDMKLHTFVVCNHEFTKLLYKISKELAMDRTMRSSAGKQFVLEAFNEFNSILDKQETKAKKVKNWLLLEISLIGDESNSSENSSTNASSLEEV